ncbi:MAG: glycosyltransferase family 9 protein [Planctomycetota bacterium]|nr:MAG: glycosyltransferase family 9 protein [Planctomycetota bacterium]
MELEKIIEISWGEKIQNLLREKKIRRVLLVGPSRVGDILFNTPVIRNFKTTFPHVELYYLSSTYAKKVLENNPYLEGVIHYNRKAPRLWRWWEVRRMVQKVKEKSFDLAFFFNMSPQIVKPLKKGNISYFYPQKGEDFPLFPEGSHALERAMDLARPLGIQGEVGPMEIYPSKKDEDFVESFLKQENIRQPFAVFHPGCYQSRVKKFHHITIKKIWPIENYTKLGERLYQEQGILPMLSAAGKGEIRLAKEIMKNSKVPFVLCPDFDILQLAALLKRAALLVTVDTGPMHVGAAMETPLVALFGPTPLSLTRPWTKGPCQVLWKGIECSPCRGKGIKCKDNICMKKITVDEVLEAAKKVLEKTNKRDLETKS